MLSVERIKELDALDTQDLREALKELLALRDGH